VRLDGLNVVALAYFEGNIWAGDTKATMGIYMDERADERQRDALTAIWGGQGGGWPRRVREPDRRALRDRICPDQVRDRRRPRLLGSRGPWKATARAAALTGPTTAPDQRVQVHNAPGAEVGAWSGCDLGDGDGRPR
jgi:hypothetical protein